jgi:hypothetical protein
MILFSIIFRVLLKKNFTHKSNNLKMNRNRDSYKIAATEDPMEDLERNGWKLNNGE